MILPTSQFVQYQQLDDGLPCRGLLRLVPRTLNKYRRAIQTRADEATYTVLKGSRWVLVKNRDELSEKEALKLAEVLAACPELRTLYLLKEEFRLIFEKVRDRDQAARFLRVWIYKAQRTGNKYLLKFVATLLNWWEEILNYFIERVTNGFPEGMNRAIRAIIRRACGYRNFGNFRLQVLAEHGPSG